MPNPIGYSFAPTFENSQLARGQAGGSQPQEALQVLSYRLPRVVGANAISPLVGDEFRGGPNMSVLESVFKSILGPEAAAALLSGSGGMPPTGSAPNPTIRPIGEAPGGAGALTPVDYTSILRGRTGGNTGIGNTGRAPTSTRDLAPYEGAAEPRGEVVPGGPSFGRNPFAGGYQPF